MEEWKQNTHRSKQVFRYFRIRQHCSLSQKRIIAGHKRAAVFLYMLALMLARIHLYLLIKRNIGSIKSYIMARSTLIWSVLARTGECVYCIIQYSDCDNCFPPGIS